MGVLYIWCVHKGHEEDIQNSLNTKSTLLLVVATLYTQFLEQVFLLLYLHLLLYIWTSTAISFLFQQSSSGSRTNDELTSNPSNDQQNLLFSIRKSRSTFLHFFPHFFLNDVFSFLRHWPEGKEKGASQEAIIIKSFTLAKLSSYPFNFF